MRPICPICSDYSLTYKEIMSLAPMPNQFVLPSVQCKNCKEPLGATVLSRTVFVIFTAWVIFKIGFHFEDPKLTPFEFLIIFVSIGTTSYFGIWPFFLRLKKWTLPNPYLPKSRLAGYFLYLILPIFLFIGILLLAAELGIGY